MFDELEKIFKQNKIHIYSQCSQKEYIDYLTIFESEKSQFEKHIIKYKKIIVEYEEKRNYHSKKFYFFKK